MSTSIQTELWMNASYRQQVRALRLIGRLDKAGRTELSENDDKGRDYHEIELHEVELQSQRGFYSYFVEDMAVFRDAREAAYHTLSAQYLQQPGPVRSGMGSPTNLFELPQAPA